MFDFLSSLAASAMASASGAQANVVQPRLASRFEPTADRAGTLPFALDADGAGDEATRERRTNGREPSIADQSVALAAHGDHSRMIAIAHTDESVTGRLNDLEQRLREWSEPIDRAPHLPEPDDVPNAKQSTPMPIALRLDESITPRNPLIARSLSTSATPAEASSDTRSQSGILDGHTETDPSLAPSKPPAILAPAPTATPQSPAPSAVTPRAVEAHVPSLHVATAPTRAPKQATPMSSQVQPQAPTPKQATPISSQAQPQAPTPAIHVSIGRIEVRATVQSPPSTTRRTAAPSPLDDYFSRRNNRGKG